MENIWEMYAIFYIFFKIQIFFKMKWFLRQNYAVFNPKFFLKSFYHCIQA
jgi:hypothetical protein